MTLYIGKVEGTLEVFLCKINELRIFENLRGGSGKRRRGTSGSKKLSVWEIRPNRRQQCNYVHRNRRPVTRSIPLFFLSTPRRSFLSVLSRPPSASYRRLWWRPAMR